MDNGALVFIIVFEAIVIVWLASKLKQYQKFEQLLGSAEPSPAKAPAVQDKAAAAVPTEAAAPPISSNGSQAVTAYDPADADDDILDMPGVDSELNIEEAKRVQLVMARCRYAEFYLEQLDDDYERGQFRHIVNGCVETARGIQDPFFRASALHPLILLLDRAGWEKLRNTLMQEVDDQHIRSLITSALREQSEEI